MSFETVLDNKEFEFVASGHGVSVLVSVTGRVHLIPLLKNSLKKSENPEITTQRHTKY
jgi:hypothetical protein